MHEALAKTVNGLRRLKKKNLSRSVIACLSMFNGLNDPKD